MTAAKPELAALSTSQKRRIAGIRSAYKRAQERSITAALVKQYAPRIRASFNLARVRLVQVDGVWLTVFVERTIGGKLVESTGVLATVGEVQLWKQLMEAVDAALER